MKTVIVANGTFPVQPITLAVLDEADFIIACDGAADKLLLRGITPQLIIGDLDSLDKETRKKYENIILHVSRQDNTDLMKAIEWCIAKNYGEISILGAVGGREDHTLGNIFTITTYATKIQLKLYTDTGFFIPLVKSERLETYKGQQVSLFPQPQQMKITTKGLKYPLGNEALPYLHSGTLNEAEGDEIVLSFDQGVLLVYRTYPSF